MTAKDKLSILVTDSGLGGLSICAHIVRRLERRTDVGPVAVTYFNAWPEPNRGYNALPDTAERVRVFDCALRGMQRFGPDVILIACNTLSVLYPLTRFSRGAPMPVVGIIDFGVEMIHAQLLAKPDSRTIIFGTPTTIEADTHRAGLTARGIPPRRIVVQPCARLAGLIEDGPASQPVRDLVEDCVRQAAASIPDRAAPVSAALCCTHYGYSETVFAQALAANFSGDTVILNPNTAMSAYPFAAPAPMSRTETRVELTVVSRIPWTAAKIATISELLAPVSAGAADALRRYRYDPELFSI